MGNPVTHDKFTYKDGILLSLILIIYCLFAFRDLGSMSAPKTLHPLTNEEYIMLDFGEHLPTHLFLYMGAAAKQDFYLYSWDYEKGEWISLNQFQVPYCFTWTDVEFTPTSSQILLQTSSEKTPLLELSFYDALGIRLIPNNTSEYPNLFDEQSTFKGYKDYRNSMYFDEIYHARTAYEYIHGLKAYENTHPPLGKILMSLGIRLFGMTPFGWRIMGTLFGVFMLPVLYLFLKKMLKDTGLPFLGTFIFAFDFMHFTQTRIATIDVYVTFFILCMYFFMYLYINNNLVASALNASDPKEQVKTKAFIKWLSLPSSEFFPLALCGLSFGLGVACKWTGVYAGMGLALIFFTKWFCTYKSVQTKTGQGKNIQGENILKLKMKTTFFMCLVFFVVLPFVIYLLSYLPMKDGTDRNLFSRMIANQSYMLSYHKDLSATHPYGSYFYQWPVMIRPAWYYSRSGGSELLHQSFYWFTPYEKKTASRPFYWLDILLSTYPGSS